MYHLLGLNFEIPDELSRYTSLTGATSFSTCPSITFSPAFILDASILYSARAPWKSVMLAFLCKFPDYKMLHPRTSGPPVVSWVFSTTEALVGGPTQPLRSTLDSLMRSDINWPKTAPKTRATLHLVYIVLQPGGISSLPSRLMVILGIRILLPSGDLPRLRTWYEL